MKQAFTYSFIIHFSFAALIIIVSSFSFKIEKPQHIQLSMEIFNNNEGSGAVAKGIETQELVQEIRVYQMVHQNLKVEQMEYIL